MKMNPNYEAVIGLEVHAQLLTESKAFSSDSCQFGDYPNTNTSPVSLGHPGALPTVNENLIRYAVKMGLATNCKIRKVSGFSRKNYFYHDLPKGYQISQYEDPICYEGHIEIENEDGSSKIIGLTRIHVEEDTGKSIHDLDIDTLIDLNRAGVPLIEIVSEPDMRSAQEAYKYLMQLKQIVMYLGICTGNMEEGALRCDANVSVMPKGSDTFGTRTEVKNMNSFRNVEKAIEYEINRQIEVIENGGKVVQETRMWDGTNNATVTMRSKEEAHDYRYFPEPDLPPVVVSQDTIDEVKSELPELPLERKKRLIEQYDLPAYDADIFVREKKLADYYENCCNALQTKDSKHFKLVSNWIMTEVMRILSEKYITADKFDVPPEHIAQLAELLAKETISSKIAKDIFPEVLQGKAPGKIVEEKGLAQVNDTSEFESIVERIVEENPESVEKYRSGRTRVMGFFVGQVMKETKGKANPKIVTELVKKYLEA